MKIKNHPNGNEYLFVAPNYWVRNFAKAAPFIDINKFTEAKDHSLLINNQITNISNPKTLMIDKEPGFVPNIVIVSDGYQFEKKLHILEKLPSNVAIIGVNRTLAKWNVASKRIMNFYLINNPYGEATNYLPSSHRYFPNCVASTRTNPDFIKRYKGSTYCYMPVPEVNFNISRNDFAYCIDDYRNPICAAIGLAYRLGVVRLLLFCCDDVFDGYRPAAVELDNKLWMYPQHRTAHDLIDANLYWLKNQPYKRTLIGSHSAGPDYTHASYIQEGEAIDFFTKEL